MSAQVAADLRAAADVLERDGWTQRAMHARGSHCAVGAIEVAIDSLWEQEDVGWTDEQNARAGAAMRLLARTVGSPLTWWNDRAERTADEVIAALRDAADAAEAQS